ncbi:hypothetical protein FOVSG1_002211 [Fusarium oxysporum f. sp. vasinfectum]
MPPSRNQETNAQVRRDRRAGPLSQPPERGDAREMEANSAHTRGRSSTPRGGRSGHQGRGGYSGRRGRGEPSSYRSSGAMSWNQPQPEAIPAFKKSATAWMTRVCAADGVVATKLTPTGRGGGFGPNWYAVTAEGYWCQSATGAGIDRMAKRLMEDEPEAVAVNAILTPVIPRVFESISSRQTQQIEMDNNFYGEDNKPVGLFGRDIQAPSEKKPVVQGECELCGSKKHILADCIERGHNGHVSGCTICNSRKHYVDSCEQFKSMSLTEQVKILVSQRAKRPPLKTSKPWHTYLHEFCTSDEFVPGVVVGFPWSKSFIEGKGRIGLRKIQSAYDADPEKYVFEVDEKTRNWEMVFKTYWQPAGKPWPKVLGSGIKAEGVDERAVKSEPDA